MNKNQKIAIGCGVGGCLGLIVLCIVGAVAFFLLRSAPMNSNRSSNFNANRSSSENSDSNTNTTKSDDSSSSSMSNDDRHKLFQAGTGTQDSQIILRVWKKLGLTDADGALNDDYTQFAKDHVDWFFKNSDFAKTVDTPEKARAYVDAHMSD